MADFDSYFKEEKAAPGQAPVTLAGLKSFDSYFADESNIPEEGLNTVENKRPGAVREALQMGLPALATGGAGILSRPMGIVGRYGLDAASGAAGEGILQALGISKQDPTMLALATAFPPLGRALGATALGLPKVIPGYRDAARAGLTEHVRALPGAIIPHGDPKAAYAAIQGNMNTVLPNWPELSATVAKHITQAGNINLPALKKMLSSGPTTDLMLNIEQALQGVPAQVIKDTTKAKGTVFGKPIGAQTVTIPAQPPGMTFENAKANIEGLSQLIRSQKGTPEVGALKDLKRAMLTDLENMPKPPGTPLAEWTAARNAYRDQKTTMMLDDVIEQHISNREGVELVNPDGILKSLRTNKELKERLTKPQMAELTGTLQDWANASGGTRSKLAAMLTGMTIGGGPAGALAGWGAAEITARMLMHEGARKMIGNIIANPAVHNIQRGMAILGAVVRGAFDEPGTTPMPLETEITPGKVLGTLPTEARTDPKGFERSPVPTAPILTPEDIKAKVTKTAKAKGLPADLAIAVAKVESGLDHSKVGTKDDVGLFQLTPIGAKDVGLGLSDRYDMDKNIDGGTSLLGKMMKRYNGDTAKALAAYNAGPTAVDSGHIPASTNAYIAKVMTTWRAEKNDKARR